MYQCRDFGLERTSSPDIIWVYKEFQTVFAHEFPWPLIRMFLSSECLLHKVLIKFPMWNFMT